MTPAVQCLMNGITLTLHLLLLAAISAGYAPLDFCSLQHVPHLLQVGWRYLYMTALVLEPFNDISVKKLSDEQIIQREMLQQFVEETFGGKL